MLHLCTKAYCFCIVSGLPMGTVGIFETVLHTSNVVLSILHLTCFGVLLQTINSRASNSENCSLTFIVSVVL